VNLTALRLAPARRTPEGESERTTVRGDVVVHGAAAEPVAPAPVALSPATWVLTFDTGERVVVETLVLVGRRPEPRPGEDGARLVALGSADMSVSKTHAQVVVAPDGALVVTDRGSTNGSTLMRKGMARPLTAGRPTTLVAGDVVNLGDRTMTVVRLR
jgi:hypothetical protein